MPLYKTLTTSSQLTVYIWKITESEDQLSENIVLTGHSQEHIKGMKSELHRRGFLSIRHLLAEVAYTDCDLYYSEDGKPYLKDGKHISITHSFEFAGIIIGDSEVGIDIEKQRDKILKIAHKFTSIQEYRTLANVQAIIRKLTIVWGAKESLYKIYAERGLSFLHHIDIKEFSIDDGATKGDILYKGNISSYQIEFLEFEEFTSVYAIRI